MAPCVKSRRGAYSLCPVGVLASGFMRKIITIATLFLAAGLTSCSNGVGAPPTMLDKDGPINGAISVDDVIDEDGKIVLTYQLGPFNLESGQPASNMLSRPAGLRFTAPEPVWIVSFEPSIEDSDGNPLPGDLVHQILLINHAEENTFCTTRQTGNPFAAATSTMESIRLPEGHGYPINPTDQLEARVILKNPTGQNHYGVYVKFTLTGNPSNETRLINDVRPMMLDADPCEHMPISVEPGSFKEETKSVYVPESGSVVGAYGLLQDYGISVAIAAGDQEEPFWKGLAVIDDEYRIMNLPSFEDPAGIPVSKGSMLNLSVAYNNLSNDWFDEATAAAMVYLARDGEGDDDSPTAPSATKAQALLLSD